MWMPVTTYQAIPHQSKELTDNFDQYERFVTCWEPVFDWQRKTVRFQSLQVDITITQKTFR